MIKKIIAVMTLSLSAMVVGGMIVNMTFSGNVMKIINVKVEYDNRDNTWRVRDNEGQNRGTLKVKRKDNISWHAKGSEMIFTFSENVDRYFEYDEGLFEDGTSQVVADDKKLRLTLRDDAPQDTLIYQVYVMDADTFVIGNSPPRVIIN